MKKILLRVLDDDLANQIKADADLHSTSVNTWINDACRLILALKEKGYAFETTTTTRVIRPEDNA